MRTSLPPDSRPIAFPRPVTLVGAKVAAPALRLVNTPVAAGHPVLRLVNEPGAAAASPARAPEPALRRQESVTRANAASSRLSDDDARVLLAVQTERRLEGGRLAILRPQQRREIHALASRVGLRPFDANLVIAVAQDRAQRGETGAAKEDARLSMIGGAAASREQGGEAFVAALIAVVIGLIMMSLMIYWVTG